MNKKQKLIKQLEGKTVILCKEELQKIDLNLFYNFILIDQSYEYYKLHFIENKVEYSFSYTFNAVKNLKPSSYDYLSDWTKNELRRWVDYIAKKENRKITQITG